MLKQQINADIIFVIWHMGNKFIVSELLTCFTISSMNARHPISKKTALLVFDPIRASP